MGKSIVELINYCGIEASTVQLLDHSIVRVNDKKRTKDCEITFATREVSANDVANSTGRFGIVVWMDRGGCEQFLGMVRK